MVNHVTFVCSLFCCKQVYVDDDNIMLLSSPLAMLRVKSIIACQLITCCYKWLRVVNTQITGIPWTIES